LLQVRSKVMYNNSNPEWNQELRLGLQVRYGVRWGRGADFSYPVRHTSCVVNHAPFWSLCNQVKVNSVFCTLSISQRKLKNTESGMKNRDVCTWKTVHIKQQVDQDVDEVLEMMFPLLFLNGWWQKRFIQSSLLILHSFPTQFISAYQVIISPIDTCGSG